MSFSALALRRAVIALCIGAVSDVRILREKGYRDVLVEAPVPVGSDGTLVPDLVIYFDDAGNAIVWEVKAGEDVRERQARKYARLTARHFRDQLYLPVEIPSGFTWDISYLSNDGSHRAVSAELQRLDLEHCVLAASDSGIRLVVGELTDDDVNTAFTAGLNFDVSAVDPAIFPFDAESEHQDIVPFLVPAILGMAIQRIEEFTVAEMTGESFGSSWAYLRLAQNERTQIFRKVRDIIRAAARQELSGYLEVRRGTASYLGDHMYGLNLDLALTQDGRPRARFLSSLGSLQRRYLPDLAAEFEMDMS